MYSKEHYRKITIKALYLYNYKHITHWSLY